MPFLQVLTLFTLSLQCMRVGGSALFGPQIKCKAAPGSRDWPLISEWNALNGSLAGRLLRPTPPGAVCHLDQPTFDLLACPAVQAGWLTTAWHADNPISVSIDNWANDTCLPDPTASCSGEGYPIYVVNATCADDVKKGVDFARKKNVRLIVKGTGHDYLGRSAAPNSLSIWTHNMRGLSFHQGFKPQGCKYSIDTHAITAAAGTQMLEINEQAHLRNLTIVSGGAGTVGIGGYLTGGGHAALSSTYGMAADQVLEMEIVTPSGQILTINECQNIDLFWAMRGGGGSTFGIITSATFKAFPSSEFVTALAYLGTVTGTEAYWDVLAQILSQFPKLDAEGISAYFTTIHGVVIPELNISTPVDACYGVFLLPILDASNSSESLENAVVNVLNTATAPYPFQFFTSVTMTTYDDFWAWYAINNGPLNAGYNLQLGSRLLDAEALTQNLTALKEAFRTATPVGGEGIAHLVGGKGVHNAQPRGGSNSINPAWRKAYVHAVWGVSWSAHDAVGQATQENLLTNTYIDAMRKLAPDMGAYVNEADTNEPNFQEAFWGENYPRLLAIKRNVDPENVFWCHPCVGNEGWQVVDDVLCKV